MRYATAFILGVAITLLGSWLLVAAPLIERVNNWVQTSNSWHEAEQACRANYRNVVHELAACKVAQEYPAP